MQQLSIDKKQKILAAARERFRYYGVAKTTMQEIAQDAGVAVGTLYLYFSNKDELIVAGTESFVERHRQEAEAILAADTPADQKLRDYILARFRHAEETRTQSRHAAEIARAVLRVRPSRIQEEGLMMWEIVTRLLALGAVQGILHVPHPEDDAKVFLYSLVYFFPNALTEPAVQPQEAELLAVVDWFLRAWRVPNPARSKRRAADIERPGDKRPAGKRPAGKRPVGKRRA